MSISLYPKILQRFYSYIAGVNGGYATLPYLPGKKECFAHNIRQWSKYEIST